MITLLQDPQFWFGSVLILTYQGAKFGEISSGDRVLKVILANHKYDAKDFAGPRAYYCGLGLFMVASFLLYILACRLPPAAITGFASLSQDNALADMLNGMPLPLAIAALYMGLTQPAVPIASKISDFQRDFFHYFFCGIPHRLIHCANSFGNQIFAKAETAADLLALRAKLRSNVFMAEIENYADTVMYSQEIANLPCLEGVKADNAELFRADIENEIRSLLFAATRATMRSTGIPGLRQLGEDLGVEIEKPQFDFGSFGAALLQLIFFFILAWVFVSLLGKIIGMPLWPQNPTFAWDSMLAHVVPLYVSVAIALAFRSKERPKTDARSSLNEVIGHNAPLLSVIFVVLLLYHVTLSLSEIGQYGTSKNVWSFIEEYSPFHLLQTLVSISAVIGVMYVDANFKLPAANPDRRRNPYVITCAATVALAILYGLLRVHFQYTDPIYGSGVDYVILSAVLAAFATASVFFVSRSFLTCVRTPPVSA